MNKLIKVLIFVLIVSAPLVFYKYFHKPRTRIGKHRIIKKTVIAEKPKVALIFDDIGGNLKDIKEIYSLNIPVTVAIVPGLKFSKTTAQNSKLYGFSVMTHLPLEPRNENKYRTNKYNFISVSLPKRRRKALLRYYLNYIKVSIGVNNHMESAAPENYALMKEIMKELKSRGLFFIDNYKSLDSVACRAAKTEGVLCDQNEGFFDDTDDKAIMQTKLIELIEKAKINKKAIIIVHPKKKTFLVLHELLPKLKNQIQFITIKDYFGL